MGQVKIHQAQSKNLSRVLDIRVSQIVWFPRKRGVIRWDLDDGKIGNRLKDIIRTKELPNVILGRKAADGM